ncbi:MAG: DUF1573 domain-containing protein [Gracilibacteraceae bacterium]|jgi:hypothetical protein|nr:DUF1573 domain-containing protein [Gracilibacteraceae bacterium]
MGTKQAEVKDMALMPADFQKTVEATLIQHQSIVDILSKGQEASAKVNRAVTKAVTKCGCLEIHAVRPEIPPDATLSDLKQLLHHHLSGELCADCREMIEAELGKQVFYLAALCNALGLSVQDILAREQDKLNTLTIFNLR